MTSKSRRRTHCPDGRPLYRVDDLPADRLATVTMLKRMRRRPADGQQPVASLLYRGNEYAPLYEIAASEEMAPLPPGRQAAWDAARTCARCAATRDVPYREHRHHWRLCEDCTVAELVADAAPSWLAGRLASVAWAQAILADPKATVLAAVWPHWAQPVDLCALDLHGRVLLDVTAAPQPFPSTLKAIVWQATRQPGERTVYEILPDLMAFTGRRTVHFTAGEPGRHGWAEHVTPVYALGEELHGDRHRWEHLNALPECRRGDGWRVRYTSWLARSQPVNHWSHPREGYHGLTWLDITAASARELAEDMLSGLRRMGADEHPDGPALCPVLPVRGDPPGRQPCGRPVLRSGRCAGHTPGARVHLPDTVRISPLPFVPGEVRRLAVPGQDEQWGGDAEVDLGSYGLFYVDPGGLRPCTGEGCGLCAGHGAEEEHA